MSTKEKSTKNPDPVETTLTYDDEINLLDYLKVIWNWKWFILLATALPTFLVGLVLFISPNTYKTTFIYDVKDTSNVYDVEDTSKFYDVENTPEVYDYISSSKINEIKETSNIYDAKNTSSVWNLNKKNFDVMVSRFFSQENLIRLANNMEKNGLTSYAEKIRNYNVDSEPFVKFETDPDYFNVSKLNISERTKLQQFIDMQASLLKITIKGKPKDDMAKIAGVIRDNIENVLSLYPIQDQLKATIKSYKNKLAKIRNNRFTDQVKLDRTRKILSALKKVEPLYVDNLESNITLQYDINSQSEYLPLNYQIHAAESKIINLEQELALTESTYNYYTDLIKLNHKLLGELSENISGSYSIDKFLTFVKDFTENTEKAEQKDFLNGYATKIENRISANEPVSDSPGVYPVPKGTSKKIVLVLVLASMISVFSAFLLENLKK